MMLLRMMCDFSAMLMRCVVPPLTIGMPAIVMGTRPGFVWDQQHHRWVDEEETWKPGLGEYSLIGPVYAPTHGHP